MSSSLPAINDKTRRNALIAELIIEGMKPEDIGKQVGLSKSQVNRIKRSDETCRQILDHAHKSMMLSTHKITDRLITDCEAEDRAKVGIPAMKVYYKNLGFGAQGNTFIQNIYNQQNNVVLDPGIKQILAPAEDEDTIEAEVIIE